LKNLAIVILVAAVVYQLWGKYNQDQLMDSSTNPNGFVEVLMPEGTEDGVVYILAPQNCPKESGQRAEAMENELKRLNIPVVRQSSISFAPPEHTEDILKKLKRSTAVVKGDIPGVFINGMARANPYVGDVIAEYERTQ